MPSFGQKSRDNLYTAEPELILLFEEVVKEFDCSVLCGHRNREDQNKAFADNKSKVSWPNSKHNQLPSKAVDVVPYPIDWDDTDRFYRFAAHVYTVAMRMNIRVKWGGSFKSFFDGPHWEKIED